MGIRLRTNGFEHVFGSRGEVQQRAKRAMKKTLNNLAYDAMGHLRDKSRTEIHTTKSFFRSGIQYQSTGASLQSKVGILDRVDLAEQITYTGERKPKRAKTIAVPLGGTKAKPRTLIGKKNIFVQRTRGGNLVLFRSTRGGINPLYVFDPITEYKRPLFHFEQHVNHVHGTFPFADRFWDHFNTR
jgi:hypothetical protein